MEIFCDSERGIFAVEAEPLAYSPLFNPYTGEEIPNENLRTEDAKLSDSRITTERDKMLERYEAIDRIHRRRLVDLMTGIVSEMTGQSLDSGNEYPASDERQDKCYVTAFRIKHAVLYACLSYDYGGIAACRCGTSKSDSFRCLADDAARPLNIIPTRLPRNRR